MGGRLALGLVNLLRHQKSIDLCSGKRIIVKGGALDNAYLITVPKSMIDGSILIESE